MFFLYRKRRKILKSVLLATSQHPPSKSMESWANLLSAHSCTTNQNLELKSFSALSSMKWEERWTVKPANHDISTSFTWPIDCPRGDHLCTHCFFSYGDRRVGWNSRQKRLWVRKDVHDKLISIFERSETNCSQPVMMAIFSNFSHERSNTNVGSQIFFPLGILRPEIPVRGTPRKIQRNLDTPLPSHTIATRFRIYVAVISFKKN